MPISVGRARFRNAAATGVTPENGLEPCSHGHLYRLGLGGALGDACFFDAAEDIGAGTGFTHRRLHHAMIGRQLAGGVGGGEVAQQGEGLAPAAGGRGGRTPGFVSITTSCVSICIQGLEWDHAPDTIRFAERLAMRGVWACGAWEWAIAVSASPGHRQEKKFCRRGLHERFDKS